VAFIKNDREKGVIPSIDKFCQSVDVFPIRSNLRDPLFHFDLLKNLISPYPYIVQRYLNKAALYRMQEIIRQHDIEAVHLDMLHLSRYQEAFNYLPVVLTNHNVESLRVQRLRDVEKNPLKLLYLNLQYKKLRDYESKICPVVSRCIVVSGEDKRILQEMCGSKNFEVVPNGVDTEYFRMDQTNSDTDGLVWVGSMSDQYNRDAVNYFMKDIFPLIKSALPNCKMVFVGKSPPEEILWQQQHYDDVITPGYVEDIRPYVSGASVFIAPMRSGSGTKLKVLNAMAQGKPVVTTSVGAEGIEAEPDEEIVVADIPKEFAEKTVYLLRHPNVARRIGLRGRNVVEEKYAWNVIENKLKQIYLDTKITYSERMRIFQHD
jgi:glycosyltransferase involved in cell wall biosynthesis